MNQIPGHNYGKWQRNMLIRNPGLALNKNILFSRDVYLWGGQRAATQLLRAHFTAALGQTRFLVEILLKNIWSYASMPVWKFPGSMLRLCQASGNTRSDHLGHWMLRISYGFPAGSFIAYQKIMASAPLCIPSRCRETGMVRVPMQISVPKQCVQTVA